ncbi:hypothetical protein BCR35DRAFT_347729 [Leucosporidium creatinivorum]|uniref:Uncharacterized protein n=1 Tax=Leucosporidium creatinivorum TaxID=106004 RepID=A0A1Y2DC42_9BASI|nr:hypothetical protein BCR35DRAFT_347729 [Leucosporidium creatinivorum]
MSAATSGSATAVDGASNSTGPRGRTSKADLITALAAELKREKERGAELSTEVERAEAGLDEKHDDLLNLEAQYEAQSRRNEQVIANLRRDLEKAKEKLEQASHCDEVETHHYLALLDGSDTYTRPHRSRPHPHSSEPQSSFSRETEAAFESPLPPPVLQPRSPDRPRPTPKSQPSTQTTASAADRTEQRLRRLNERLADEDRSAPSSRVPNHSSSSALATQKPPSYQLNQTRPLAQSPKKEEKGFDVVERSQWNDSMDSPPRARDGGDGLSRSGSRWSKIFPGAHGKKYTPPSSISSSSSTSSDGERIVYLPPSRSLRPLSSSSHVELRPATSSALAISSDSRVTLQSTTSFVTAPVDSPPSPFRTPSFKSFQLAPLDAHHHTASASASEDDMPLPPGARPSPSPSAIDLSNGASLSLADYDPSPTSNEFPAAIGRKGGAKMLASEEARRAQEKAQGYHTDDFSLNSRILNSVESSPDTSRNPTPMRREPIRQASAPYPTTESLVDPQASREPEGSMNELTRRASAEEQMVAADGNSSSARKRDGWTKGVASGLGSPFFGTTPSQAKEEPLGREKRHPPVSGETRRREMRSRSTSVGSTGSRGSVNKDNMLQQLADALKSERRRNKLYEEEILLAEEEVDYFSREIEIVKEKYTNRFEQHEQTINALRAELEEVKAELETAYDLDPEAAEQFLSLLTSKPLPSKGPIVQAFTPSALNDPSPTPTTTPTKPSRFRSSKAKRRVDAHIAAHDSSDADGAVVQPSGKTSLWRRGRKLSKTRAPPMVESISLPTLQTLGAPEGAPPPIGEGGVGMGGGAEALKGLKMRAVESTPELGGKLEKGKKKPPVSGENHLVGAAGGEGVRTRKRTNSFKKGLAGTLRVMFPSNAASNSKPSASSLYPDAPPPDAEKVQAWLTQGGRGTDGRTKVGTGYSNPFDSR